MARAKKSSTFASLWVWLLLLGGGFLAYRYQQTGSLIDRAGAAGRVNAAVDDALSARGVKNSQIVKVTRIERKRILPFPKTWIETERHISGVSYRDAAALFSVLKKSSESLKIDACHMDSNGERVLVELGSGGALYQRLIFLNVRRAEHPSVAIVIDDVAGRPDDLQRLDAFLALGIPLTFALLPSERVAPPAAERIHAKGHEIILHQPMEPQDSRHNPPGDSALLTSMSRAQIRRLLEENLAKVPHVSGFSNHMGSGFTSDARSMEALIESAVGLQKRYPGLYFFDSHTAQHPPSPEIAGREGLPHLINDLFLDNVDSEAAMAVQLEKVKDIALRRGHAAAIGHIQRRHMAAALKKAIPKFKKEGVRFVTLSELLR